MPYRQARSGFASCSAGRSGLGSLRALQVGLVSKSVGGRGGSTMPASGRAHYRLSSGDRLVAGIRHVKLPGLSGSPISGGLEVGLFNTC